MLRLLLLVPLIVAPPVLTAGYFLRLEPAGRAGASNAGAPDDESPQQTAQAAFDRASRLLQQARLASEAKKADLLLQAVIQYRVCLAYEPAVEEGSRLFADARHNLEASRLLLAQSKEVPLAQAAPEAKPAPPAPAVVKLVSQPVPPGKPKEKAQPMAVATVLPPAPESPKPIPPARSPKKIVTVGPDGVIYERIDKQ